MEMDRAFIEKIIKIVMEEMRKEMEEVQIPLGVSNRHLHLCREDMDILFGKGSELNKLKDLRQPGQYAAEETVAIRGPKGELQNVRVLGPLRSKTQFEMSVTDSFAVGLKAMVRESGKIDGTPGFEIIGPCGSVQKKEGAIVAMRHIHLSPEAAERLGVKDKQIVKTEVGSVRKTIFDDVLIRVSSSYLPEMHLDMDEANACLGKNGDLVKIVKEAPANREVNDRPDIPKQFLSGGQSAEISKKVISVQTIMEHRNYRRLVVRKDSIVTALAREEANKRGIEIERRR